MTKELEALEKVYYGSQGYGDCDENYKIVKQALHRLESIDNANPSEALEDLIDMIEYFTRLDYVEPIVRNEIHDKFKDIYWHKLPHLDSIKEALLKAQEQEKEKLFFKNIHNTKIKTPLVSIFEGLSKEERYKFTEHLYYHWEEMKEALEDKNNELEKENTELKAEAQKEHKALEIIKEKNVDVRWIEVCDTVKDYNKGRDEHLNYELTEEEFNTLKEVLE